MSPALDPYLTIDRFEAGLIDPERFDHAAHVYVGWLYVREYGPSQGLPLFDAALRRLVASLGAERKYHATITRFFLTRIAERQQEHEAWSLFKQRNADLVEHSSTLLNRYYSNDYLFSDRARQHYLPPDRITDEQSAA